MVQQPTRPPKHMAPPPVEYLTRTAAPRVKSLRSTELRERESWLEPKRSQRLLDARKNRSRRRLKPASRLIAKRSAKPELLVKARKPRANGGCNQGQVCPPAGTPASLM